MFFIPRWPLCPLHFHFLFRHFAALLRTLPCSLLLPPLSSSSISLPIFFTALLVLPFSSSRREIITERPCPPPSKYCSLGRSPFLRISHVCTILFRFSLLVYFRSRHLSLTGGPPFVLSSWRKKKRGEKNSISLRRSQTV